MKILGLLSAISASSIPLLASTSAQSSVDWEWMSHSGWGWGGMMVGGGLMMLVFWGAIIFLIVMLVRGLGGFGSARQPDQTRQSALEILRERFARGEIDRQEYEERQQILDQ